MPEAVPPPRSSRPRSSTMILVALTGVVLLVFAATIGVVVVAVRGTGGGDVAEGSFLQVRLAGEISDAPAVGGF